jgi:release factor glutamine methyltransferase
MSEREDIVTVADALLRATFTLRKAGLDEARREAASLLSYALGRDSAFLITHADEEVAGAEFARFQRLVARRAGGEPLQYIKGRQEFYGLDFEVNPDVLIPRPETELLVETALELLRETRDPFVCDVGTGSGCIAVTLLHERRDAHALAIDISDAALEVAARNAARHGVGERLTTLASDCFDALKDGTPEAAAADFQTEAARFQLIASNPPYVAERDLAGLQREVREHEPRMALTPGGDGLSVIRRLLDEAPQFLARGGHLLFEIGFNQHEAVHNLIDASTWALLDIHRDLQGIPRTVALRLRE